MSIKKTMITGLASIGLIVISTHVLASDLHINNNTSNSSTTKTKGYCSNYFIGDAGVTHPNDHDKIVTYEQLVLACGGWGDCNADVYMTDNCELYGDTPVANVQFNTETGLKGITMYSSRYSITGSGFNMQIDTVA